MAGNVTVCLQNRVVSREMWLVLMPLLARSLALALSLSRRAGDLGAAYASYIQYTQGMFVQKEEA